MKYTKELLNLVFDKWIKILRLKNNWDILLELVEDESFKKTGDFKIDCDDKKAIIMLNVLNPKNENMEEVIVHELLHLKMYPLDQFTETMIINNYEHDSNTYNLMYHNFFLNLEITVEELTKCFLGYYGENKELSFGRCKEKKSFDELFGGLKSIK